jgi:CheY-like chemotaxis protein
LQAAEAIELAAARGATLTRQLLSFSRRQSLQPTTVNLAETVEAVRPILGSVLGASVQYLTTILPGVWPVLVDVSELELAIVNLVVNARDAMSQGGAISVTAENVQLAGDDTPDHLEGEFVALTVADTGHGIPPDILARVFDPFFTTKAVGKGTGLGLSQVHGFVHQLGGSVTIASEVGQGTRITLYLPRATDEPVAEAPARPESGIDAGRKVLLVEDNPEVAHATAELLQRMGCEAQIAGNAAAALDAVAAGDFDVLLSDIVMAGAMNGLDLAREVRRHRPHLQIVLATGYSDAEAQAGREFTVLRKPYKLEDLDRAFAVPAQGNIVEFQGREARAGF